MTGHESNVGRATIAHFASHWLAHGFANLPRLLTLPTLARLSVAGPVVVVGLGPSLERNIEHLTRARGRALLVTSTHALTTFDRLGIVPDVVVAIDVQDLRWQLASLTLERVPVGLAGVTVNPEVR